LFLPERTEKLIGMVIMCKFGLFAIKAPDETGKEGVAQKCKDCNLTVSLIWTIF
jgi:hypothetical protein